MPTYHVKTEFDITISDEDAQQHAHDWYRARFGDTPVQSDIVSNPQQANDHFAQNLDWAITVVVNDILAAGADLMSQSGRPTTLSDAATTTNAPSGPV